MLQPVTKIPSRIQLYSRALLRRREVLVTPRLPDRQCLVSGLKINRDHLHRFKECCGFNVFDERIPPTYFHLLAMPAHLTLLTDNAFPFPLLGLIHRKNMIQSIKSISDELTFDLTLEFGNLQLGNRGFEFELITELRNQNELFWRSISTMLYRSKQTLSMDGKTEERVNIPALEMFDFQPAVEVKGNIGRRYAIVSGDFNPIHLSAISAKLFGFNRAIAHGMWSQSWVLARLGEEAFQAQEISVDFKKPLFIPGTIALGHCIDGETHWRCVKNPLNNEPHLFLKTGKLTQELI